MIEIKDNKLIIDLDKVSNDFLYDLYKKECNRQMCYECANSILPFEKFHNCFEKWKRIRLPFAIVDVINETLFK